MGKVKNNYFSLAYNDLHYLLCYDEDDEYSYNKVAVEAQQVVEKILKGIVELCDSIDINEKSKLLGSHNLRKLGTTINEHCAKNLNIPNLAYLKDFYFEARYPGDNFIEVTKKDRDKCMEITFEVLKEVEDLCSDFPSELKKMSILRG